MYVDRIVTAKIIVGSLSLAYMCQKMIFEVGNDIILLFLCTENFHQWNWFMNVRRNFFLFTHHVVMQTFFNVHRRIGENFPRILFCLFTKTYGRLQALYYEKKNDEKYFCEWFYRHNNNGKYQAEIFFPLSSTLMVTFQYIFFRIKHFLS